ncbi:MAG: SDR family oxidoreductase [Proteobacteria bacterium]|nr:SDR family oxidoreductase [Pseudomonadota bacterium]
MSLRLENKIAVIIGAGQTPGDTPGNGRAMAQLFAREGARVMVVDRRLDSAMETKALIEAEGGQALAFEADVIRADDCRRLAEKCVETYGRIDVLVNNVGIATGDAGAVRISEEAWDHIQATNLKSMMLTCKFVLPVMEAQGGGSIINISSVAAVAPVRMLAYKTSKAAVNALTQGIAMKYAKKGIRVNALMLGLMNTPMAIEGISKGLGVDKEALIEARNKSVPLKGGMGNASDTAYAALFLASDESRFITAVILPVDGGQSAKIG